MLSWGSSLRRTVSRIHMEVLGSTGPMDRYSAMPSMNQRGMRRAVLVAPRLVRVALGHDVVLEGVDELVPDDMVGLG